MKVAVISDTHIGARLDSLVFAEYFCKFFDEVFFPYLEKNGIKTLIHAGDIFDRRKFINFNILSIFQDRFAKELVRRGIESHIILGNHDCYFNNRSDLNSVDTLFGHLPNVHIYRDPTVINIGGFQVGLCPWINRENQDKSLEFIATTSAPILVGHFGITGFQVMPGHKYENGTDPKIFQRFDMVLSGHFHGKQSYENIHYLGCPYEITFADQGISKGFHILDLEKRSLDFVINPHTIFSKIFYDDEKFDYSTFCDFSGFHRNFVKVVVVRKTNQSVFDNFITQLYNAGPSKVEILEEQQSIQAVGTLEVGEDTMSSLIKYVDSLELTDDKTPLKTLLQELYTEAQNIEL